jgi:Flp pilus assembly protein TadB
MLFFAVTTTEKLKQVPGRFWLIAALVIVALFVAIVVLRKIWAMNKIVLAIVLAVAFVLVGFNWVYQRNEPKFLTPFVDAIAPFFPSKSSYGAAKPH